LAGIDAPPWYSVLSSYTLLTALKVALADARVCSPFQRGARSRSSQRAAGHTFPPFAGLCERCLPCALQSTTRHSAAQANSRSSSAPSSSRSGSVCPERELCPALLFCFLRSI
jgi:hypothetical protein